MHRDNFESFLRRAIADSEFPTEESLVTNSVVVDVCAALNKEVHVSNERMFLVVPLVRDLVHEVHGGMILPKTPIYRRHVAVIVSLIDSFRG
ncbi:MAG: hypothetical protein KBC81_03850 [Candidatus Pacebacteria bacterium]|nr:hypothetical protein [Candidatus Paceibacterota bacterium]